MGDGAWLRVTMEGPIGALTWLNTVTLAAIGDVPGFDEGVDRSQFPDFPWKAREWAFWRCVDELGGHWSRVGDAAVVRAAWTWPGGLDQPREGVRNWWVENVPHSAFPALLPGWYD